MDTANVSPALVEAICNYIKQNGKYQEGIFRISPSRNNLMSLRTRLREEGDQFLINDLANNSTMLDPHTVASLLKSLLSESSEPLLSGLALNLDLNSLGNSDDANEDIRRNFSLLSPDVQRSAEAILVMLHELIAFSDATRMGAGQFSVVFAPALFGCPDTPESLSRFHQVTQLMHRLIVNPIKREKCSRDKHIDVEGWLKVVRCVIRERLFSRSSEMCTDVIHLPSPASDTSVVQTSDSAKSNNIESSNSRININVDLVQLPTNDDLPELGSTAPFHETSQTAPSYSRSLQLTRIAGVLCERFGISTDRKKHSISPIEEKIALQKALLQLEGSFGRPIDKAERQIVRPLYERYRELKRLAANSGARSNYHHHASHHEQRRHKHQLSSGTNAADNSDIADVWATPSSSNRFAGADSSKCVGDKDYNVDDIVDFDPQLIVKHQNIRSERRKSRESRNVHLLGGRNDSTGNESVTSPTIDDDFSREQSNLGEIKQVALNSSSG